MPQKCEHFFYPVSEGHSLSVFQRTHGLRQERHELTTDLTRSFFETQEGDHTPKPQYQEGKLLIFLIGTRVLGSRVHILTVPSKC